MIKKITLATALLFNLANAEINQTGYFMGVNITKSKANIEYIGTDNLSINLDVQNLETNSLSYKLGYQYYFTRVYALFSKNKYKEPARNKYTIDVSTYELNAEYLPIIYMNDEKKWDIRGVFGIGVGYNNTTINHNLSAADYLTSYIDADSTQNAIEYGVQVGVISELDIGLSVEIGLRYRQGTLLEYTDGTDKATFALDTSEYYLGVNYLF